MFMRGCPPALEAKRDQINCRADSQPCVTLSPALSALRVRRTVCLESRARDPPRAMRTAAVDPLDLLFRRKVALLGYEGTELRRRRRPQKHSR